ncbi:MAG: extracellular solute-binding protein [Chloroflexi bacterium]|nr:extracellular solute-binding protein [Chloroflexota bacterium]
MAAGALGATLLEACGPASAPTPAAPAATSASGGATPASGSAAAPAAAGAGGKVALPTYVAFQGPTPDLPGNEQGLDPAFFKFPSNLTQTVTTPPGDGSTVTAITYLTLAPPPPMEQNAAWQAVNKSLNATLQMEQVGSSDYATRINVVIAGNDLPDFIYNPTTTTPWGAIPGLPSFLQAKCQDLSQYLSGDAIKDYPNLAHYDNYTWRSGVVNNKIYAIPVARPPIGAVMMYRKDLLDKEGITEQPKSADDFKRALQAVTKPDQNQYGIASNATNYFALTPNSAYSSIWRVPNNWRLDPSGKLIKDVETDEFKAAVGFSRDLWQAGLWHPNSPQYGGTYNDDFMAGRFVFAPGVWGQYVQLWDIEALRVPDARLYPMQPFAADGGKPYYQAGSGQFGVTYMKQQSSPDRIKMLLRVANFFAAPFGSKEWLLNYFGVQDTDFKFNADGAPVLTDQGRSELTAVWRYVSSPAYALFSANRSQEFAQVSYAAEQAMIAAMDVDPTLGLYSATAASSGQLAQDTLMSGVSDIIQGRRPVTDLDGLVADWRNSVGDKMRGEFQDAIAASKS